jgi:cysteine desulfurase
MPPDSKTMLLPVVAIAATAACLSVTLASLAVITAWWKKWDEDDESLERIENEQLFEQETLLQHKKEQSNGNKDLYCRQQDNCVYLDYNGTTPVYSFVYQSMIPYFTTYFGNPSSSHHAYGRIPAKAIQQARQQVCQLLSPLSDLSSSSIWFTSCGTESDNLAIQLALERFRQRRCDAIPHIVTTNIEHPAVANYLARLEARSECTVCYVPVQRDGRVSADQVKSAIQLVTNVALVTVMLANNETGALNPVSEISRYCRQHDILFHTDAAQAAGKVSIQLDQLGDPDLVTIVGHKIGAPKGVAALYVRPGCLQSSGQEASIHSVLLVGGGQEFGHRGGTENVPYIVGFGVAACAAQRHLTRNANHMERLRSLLLSELRCSLENFKESRSQQQPLLIVNGPENPQDRLPNTLSVGIRGIHSGRLLAIVGDQVAASAGAACHSHQPGDNGSAETAISSVLRAMKVPIEYARGTIRLSIGPTTTEDDIRKAVSILSTAVRRQWSETTSKPCQGVPS